MRNPFGSRRARGIAACLLALLLAAPPAARAEDARKDEGYSPVPNGPVPKSDPGKGGYEAVGPSERRGRADDLEERESSPGDAAPATGGGDPGDFRGEARDLEELSRPPGPTRKKADWEQEGIPGPLKIRRLPNEAPPPDAPLLVRMCDADAGRAFAERELRDAVRSYKRARRGEYPRGRDKWLVIERRTIALRRVERADTDWRAVLAEAETAQVEFAAESCP